MSIEVGLLLQNIRNGVVSAGRADKVETDAVAIMIGVFGSPGAGPDI